MRGCTHTHTHTHAHTHTHGIIPERSEVGLAHAPVSLRAGLATEVVRVRTRASVCVGVCITWGSPQGPSPDCDPAWLLVPPMSSLTLT